MKTAMEEYIEKHDKKIEEDAQFAVDYFQSLVVDVWSDIGAIKDCIGRMKKNQEIPAYIQHRFDMISSAMSGAESNMEQVLNIVKKAEEDENKNKEKNNDNNQEKCVRDEQLVNPCGSDSTEGCLPEAEG